MLDSFELKINKHWAQISIFKWLHIIFDPKQYFLSEYNLQMFYSAQLKSV